MQAYSSSGDVTGGAVQTIIAVAGSAYSRVKLIQVIIGCSGSPADNVAKFAIRRFTTDGTGSAGTVFAADSGGPTPRCTSKYNYTVEPTYVAGYLVEVALNQRNTVIWNAPLGAEILAPIGTDNGIGVEMVSGPALAYNVTMVWEE